MIGSLAYIDIIDGGYKAQTRTELDIYISEYPTITDFEAVWNIWIVNTGDEDNNEIIETIKAILPGFFVNAFSSTDTLIVASVRSLRSSNTETRPVKKEDPSEVVLRKMNQSFEALREEIQDQMLLVNSGKNGKDGKDGIDGKDGRNGRDGKDLVKTDASIEDIEGFELEKHMPLMKGQVMTFDGENFTNLLIPSVTSVRGGGTVVTASGANVIISETKPLTREDGSALQSGDEWWNSMTGVSFIWYIDDDSGQWVQQSGGGASTVNSLNDLADVEIDPALLATDQGLLYDGTNFTVGSPPVLIDATNTTGLPITKGTPVCVTGTAPSGKPQIGLASNNDPTGKPAIGLADRDIEAGGEGYVLVSGKLFQLDTSAYQDGDALYLSSTPGVLTPTRPLGPTDKVQKVGLVTRVHPTVGTILVIGAGRANDVNNEIITLTGVGLNSTDLGTFAGSTIGDNGTIKGALQDLEGAVEDRAVEAPQDGNYYVRQNGAWVELGTALTALGYNFP